MGSPTEFTSFSEVNRTSKVTKRKLSIDQQHSDFTITFLSCQSIDSSFGSGLVQFGGRANAAGAVSDNLYPAIRYLFEADRREEVVESHDFAWLAVDQLGELMSGRKVQRTV